MLSQSHWLSIDSRAAGCPGMNFFGEIIQFSVLADSYTLVRYFMLPIDQYLVWCSG